MGSLYSLTPQNAAAPFAAIPLATTTSRKTLLQVACPGTTDIRIWGWGVSFDGAVSSNPPGVCELIITTSSVNATVTALTPDKWGSSNAPASLCVSGTVLTGYDASAEGTLTSSRATDTQHVHPQTGYSVWFPTEQRPTVANTTAVHQIRIRTTFSVSVNCIPWVVWEEPV